MSLPNNLNKMSNEKRISDKNTTKLVVFNNDEISILKDRDVSYDTLNKVKLIKNIFDGVLIS